MKQLQIENFYHFFQEASTGSVSSFEDYSPCPSTPIEHVYRRQHSNSNNIGEVGMHWRLIPITGKMGFTICSKISL